MQAGLYKWFARNARGRKGQQGFTLIELLVVVTILGILAGIVTLSLVGLTTNANVQSCNTEYKTVQAAIDAAMANNNLEKINAQTTATNDMKNTVLATVSVGGTPQSVTLFTDAPSATKANYTRNGTTQFYYKWNTVGKITDIYTDKAGSKTLPGCSVIS